MFGLMNFLRTPYMGAIEGCILAKFFPVSNNLNKKDKLNNFVVLLEESMSTSFYRFVVFIRSVSNNHINDESLQEYFYRVQNDNNKAVLDTISGVHMKTALLRRL